MRERFNEFDDEVRERVRTSMVKMENDITQGETERERRSE
jgi:hypothetical protein